MLNLITIKQSVSEKQYNFLQSILNKLDAKIKDNLNTSDLLDICNSTK